MHPGGGSGPLDHRSISAACRSSTVARLVRPVPLPLETARAASLGTSALRRRMKAAARNGSNRCPSKRRACLFPLKAEVRNAQVARIVSHHAFDVLGEAARGLGVNIEGQGDLRAADAVEFA